jgi:hypothetical protein
MYKLNLGCGGKILRGWENIDRIKLPGVDVVYDLESASVHPLPYGDNSVSVVYMSHVLEHLHAVFPLMEELYRVCCDSAVVVIRVPAFSSDEAWIDPTHVRPWHPRSFLYFSAPKYHSFDYGFRGDFQPTRAVYVVRRDLLNPGAAINLDDLFTSRGLWTELVMYLRVVKPMRVPNPEQLRHGIPEIAVEKHLINIPEHGVVDLY